MNSDVRTPTKINITEKTVAYFGTFLKLVMTILIMRLLNDYVGFHLNNFFNKFLVNASKLVSYIMVCTISFHKALFGV